MYPLPCRGGMVLFLGLCFRCILFRYSFCEEFLPDHLKRLHTRDFFARLSTPACTKPTMSTPEAEPLLCHNQLPQECKRATTELPFPLPFPKRGRVLWLCYVVGKRLTS